MAMIARVTNYHSFRTVAWMQYSTIPFTLVARDEAYLIDVDALYTAATTFTDGRDARGRRYPLALFVTVTVLAKLAGFVHMEDVADWAKLRRSELQQFFRTKRATMPHHTNWSRAFGVMDVTELDHLIQQFLAPPSQTRYQNGAASRSRLMASKSVARSPAAKPKACIWSPPISRIKVSCWPRWPSR